ncbi:hypothetical protein ACHAQH_003054 [Verticillium albo-atrum]
MAPGKVGPPAEKEQPPPTYESSASNKDTIPAVAPQVQAQSAGQGNPSQGLTAESPFSFPADTLPPYAPSTAPSQLIVIPQQSPEPTSPFLQAYAPSLLGHGIPSESWVSFIDTLSAFLAAKVSDRALSHAADVAKQLGQGPTDRLKGVYTHAKDVGKGISQQARRGNVIGAISVPLSAAFGLVGTVASLPGSAVMAVSKKPASQRDRATAYLAVANRDWFHARGLDAAILTTEELESLTGTSVLALIATVSGKGEVKTAGEQLAALEGHFAKLEVLGSGSASLKVAGETLWVVLSTVEPTTK